MGGIIVISVSGFIVVIVFKEFWVFIVSSFLYRVFRKFRGLLILFK